MPTKPKIEKKQCTRCKKRKPVSEFYGDKSAKDERSPWCRPCTSEYDRAYRARKKAEVAS